MGKHGYSYDTEAITGRRSRTPILTTICNITGLLTMLAAAFVIFVAIQERGPLFMQALLVGVGVIFFALVQFGIGQVVDYVAQTAHRTAQLVDIAERIEKQKNQQQ